jgi:hypothetical protein
MSAAASPRVDLWLGHLRDRMVAAGHEVEARRKRCGATAWRIDGGRWLTAFQAARRMEVAVYGREYP